MSVYVESGSITVNKGMAWFPSEADWGMIVALRVYAALSLEQQGVLGWCDEQPAPEAWRASKEGRIPADHARRVLLR